MQEKGSADCAEQIFRKTMRAILRNARLGIALHARVFLKMYLMYEEPHAASVDISRRETLEFDLRDFGKRKEASPEGTYVFHMPRLSALNLRPFAPIFAFSRAARQCRHNSERSAPVPPSRLVRDRGGAESPPGAPGGTFRRGRLAHLSAEVRPQAR